MDSERPSVVIVSSSNTKPKSLIKLITKDTDLNDDPNEINKISHPWKINTKYYTALVTLHGINLEYKRSAEFNQSVEALIIHMDSNKESGLNDLEKWKIIEDECKPDVKLLICNYCSNTKITKAKATEWCIKRGYELIELYPQELPVKDEDEIIEEKYGIDRIIEVLQTHVWSNLEMKDKSTKSREELVKNEESNNVGNNENDIDNFEEGSDDFTELFAQLQMMKESVQSMPLQERKQCAEQLVTAFWKAIGGDDEEIEDI